MCRSAISVQNAIKRRGDLIHKEERGDLINKGFTIKLGPKVLQVKKEAVEQGSRRKMRQMCRTFGFQKRTL